MFIKFAHYCIALSQLDLVYLMCRIVIYMHTVTQSHRQPIRNFGIFRGKLPGFIARFMNFVSELRKIFSTFHSVNLVLPDILKCHF